MSKSLERQRDDYEDKDQLRKNSLYNLSMLHHLLELTENASDINLDRKIANLRDSRTGKIGGTKQETALIAYY